ncbi:Hypothetical_protein [Hexamita inflata]|uniref:Hypothetical_protein n=1 Tax=Hexamita inflata TaxID=28002 RepID=A0AA86UMC7_9EUKA|nr:Hypothetical protein HINF_LOCUS44656 [Hexamita inflata]
MVEVVFENFVNYLRSGNTDKLNIISFQQNQQHKINLSTQLIFDRILTKTVVQLTKLYLLTKLNHQSISYKKFSYKNNENAFIGIIQLYDQMCAIIFQHSQIYITYNITLFSVAFSHIRGLPFLTPLQAKMRPHPKIHTSHPKDSYKDNFRGHQCQFKCRTNLGCLRRLFRVTILEDEV